MKYTAATVKKLYARRMVRSARRPNPQLEAARDRLERQYAEMVESEKRTFDARVKKA